MRGLLVIFLLRYSNILSVEKMAYVCPWCALSSVVAIDCIIAACSIKIKPEIWENEPTGRFVSAGVGGICHLFSFFRWCCCQIGV